VNRITIDLDRQLGQISPNIFGGFVEHLGRCIYGGIYEPQSPHADENGFRKDVLTALRRLNMPIIRYPGGNFASGYRWRDGVGPRAERPVRPELAWHTLESNQIGTNEFVDFCRLINTQPFLVVNAGDGDMREARDWVEYCNGNNDTALVKLRRQHGYDAPHRVQYWGIGNEVDGHWQIGYKTASEYARTFTEFGKVMKWADPEIKLIASMTSDWGIDWVERAQLLIEQAGNLVDYMGIHWYVGNNGDNFANYMTVSEMIEERLSAYEGLIRALQLNNRISRPIWIAVDEWNVWYRTFHETRRDNRRLEEIYSLEDALVVAMQLNAFIRHARSVKMANLAQIVNVIAPIFTSADDLFLQTIFHPFELYRQACGDLALDVFWECDTFSGADYSGVRYLDVTASLNTQTNETALFVVNRHPTDAIETTISLSSGNFKDVAQIAVVNGADIKTSNSFEQPDAVTAQHHQTSADGASFVYAFEPHSVTVMTAPVR
jgi:alpha-N-arabinofuranosidase